MAELGALFQQLSPTRGSVARAERFVHDVGWRPISSALALLETN